MKNIVIVGMGGHAKVVIDIIETGQDFKIIGFCDSFISSSSEKTYDYTFLGKETDLPELIKAHSIEGVIVAIGDNFTRFKVSSLIKEICPDLDFVSAIHPKASIAKSVKVGKGSVIISGVVINPYSVIGESCILNTGSSIDHDCTLGDFTSMGPGARIGGNCNVGRLSAIAMSATLIHGINIGEETVIGASATVFNHMDSRVVAYGNPAKVIRMRNSEDKYL